MGIFADFCDDLTLGEQFVGTLQNGTERHTVIHHKTWHHFLLKFNYPKRFFANQSNLNYYFVTLLHRIFRPTDRFEALPLSSGRG
jgi:hypothetical protein